MDARSFSQFFPKLYHLTFASNLPGIRQHGLHSAHSLGKLHSFDEEECEVTLTLRRRCIQSLHGVCLRDQHAANEKKMRSCLVGISIPEWLALLNSRIFFFVEREKALRLAEVYRDYSNVLLEIDSARLVRSHAEQIALCRVSSGSFLYNPRPRGRDSFIPLSEYVYRKKRDTPAELTVDGPIYDILEISRVVELPRAQVVAIEAV